MPAPVNLDTFLNLAQSHPIFDARTPDEFTKGHIPNALNLPLFSNEERHLIGSLYKRQGRQPALLEGLDVVGPKMRALVEAVQQAMGHRHQTEDQTILIHCWRGGMRSASLAWLLSFAGNYTVHTLAGGYKAYRQFALHTFAKRRPIFILGGHTGSGKTEVLQVLQQRGEQTIDLEAIAHHKGSAFGALGQLPAPSQQQFENELAWQLHLLDPTRPLWVEDESRRIGKRTIPDSFWHQMRAAPVFFLDVPKALRMSRLVATYGGYPTDQMEQSIVRLNKRLGGSRMKQALEALHTGDLTITCSILLEYYDQAYNHGLNKREAGTITVVASNTLHAETNATLIMEKAVDSYMKHRDKKRAK